MRTEQEEMNSVVSIQELHRRFRRKEALKGVSLEVKPGKVFGLVGENGAGKTTLIKHILGSLKAQQGAVRVFGRDPVQDPEGVLSQIGYLSEDRDLPGWMRVAELIRYTAAFYPQWDAAFAEELRRQFGLESGQRIRRLSRGEKARAGLLAALAHRPPLLLLDEPSSGLDPLARRDILAAIVRTIAEEGRTVIFSSHLLGEVERVADEVAMIHQGRLVFQGEQESLKARFTRAVIRVGADFTGAEIAGLVQVEGHGREREVMYEGDLQELAAGLQGLGGEILEDWQADLESIFLAKVSQSFQGGAGQ